MFLSNLLKLALFPEFEKKQDGDKNVRIRVRYVQRTRPIRWPHSRGISPWEHACASTFGCSAKQIQTDGVVTSRGESCPALLGKGLKLTSRRKGRKYVFGVAEISFPYCVRLTMATKSRTTVKIAVNQENCKNLKSSVAILPTKTKRPVLREISNKVNTLRGVEPIDRTSLLQKDKKVVTVAVQKRQPVKHETKEKISEKPPVQVVKPVVKTIVEPSESNTPNEDPTSMNISDKKVETPKAFSSDLIYEDIDEQDEKNPILVALYTNEIHEYLRGLENKYLIQKGYLAGQEVTPKMRSVLVDWLVDVHQQFRLMQETLYLTVAVIDRFLQAYRTIDRKRLQLVGVTAMFIASKYEEMYSPDISDFVYITDQAYTKSDILKMEMVIVKHLNFSFGRPLPLHFLRRYSKAGKALPIHHTMAKYFLEQSLIHYDMCHYQPSLIAAAAIYLAFIIIGNDEQDEGKVIWTNTLAHYSTYSKDDVLPAVRDIAVIITNAETSKYQAVRKKYVHSKYMEISVRPELKSPTLLAIAKANNKT